MLKIVDFSKHIQDVNVILCGQIELFQTNGYYIYFRTVKYFATVIYVAQAGLAATYWQTNKNTTKTLHYFWMLRLLGQILKIAFYILSSYQSKNICSYMQYTC